MKKIEFPHPIYKLSDLPVKVIQHIIGLYVIGVLMVIIIVSALVTIPSKNLLFASFMMIFLYMFIVLHTMYIFMYDKVCVIECTCLSVEIKKTGKYLYASNGNVTYKIRIPIKKYIRKNMQIRIYAVPSAISNTGETCSVTSYLLMHSLTEQGNNYKKMKDIKKGQ